MDATNYGSMGIQVTSPFKSSGRSKQLLGDAQRFQTIAYEGSNIGPGSYDAGASYIGRISVSPTANDRVFRANRAKDKEDAAFRETLKTLSRSHICSADRCSTPNSTSDSSKLTKMTKLSTIESWEDGPLTPLPNSSKPCIGVSKKKASPTGESSVGSTRTSKSYQLHLLNCRKAEIMEVERLPSYE